MKTCRRCQRDYPDEIDFIFNDGVEICPACDRLPYPWDFIDDSDDPQEYDEYICCGERTSGGYCCWCGTQYG